MLYEIMPNAPWSTLDLENLKLGLHVDGIFSSSQIKVEDIVSKYMQQLSIQQTVGGSDLGLITPTTQSLDVHTMKSKTQKGPHHPRERKKGKGKKGSGRKYKKDNKNTQGEKDQNIKLKFP
jgi:hypothetical protein